MKKFLLLVFLISIICCTPVSAEDPSLPYFSSSGFPGFPFGSYQALPYFASTYSNIYFTHTHLIRNDSHNYSCYASNDPLTISIKNGKVIINSNSGIYIFGHNSSFYGPYTSQTLVYLDDPSLTLYLYKGSIDFNGYEDYFNILDAPTDDVDPLKYNPYRLSVELYDRFSGTYNYGSQPYDYFVTDYIIKAISVASDKDRYPDLDSTHVLSADSKFNYTTTYRIPSYHQCYLYYQEFVQSGSLDSSHPETIQRQLLDYAHSHPMPSYFVFPLRSFSHEYNYDLFVKAYTTIEPSYYSLNKTGHAYAFTDGIYLFEDLKNSLDTSNSEYNLYTLALQLYFAQPQYVTITREDPLTVTSPFTFYFDYTLTNQQQTDILNNIASGDIHYSSNGSIYSGGGRRDPDPDSSEVDTVDTKSLDSLANSIVVPVDNDTYNSSVLTFLDALFSSIPSQIWSVLFFGLGTLVVIFALKVLWG